MRSAACISRVEVAKEKLEEFNFREAKTDHSECSETGRGA